MSYLSNIINKKCQKYFSKENIICINIVITIFYTDRFTKKKIIDSLANEKSIFINDYLNLELVWNNGIGFGLLNLEPNIYYHLISLTIFLVILFLIYLISKSDLLEKILFSTIIGGAIGNFYDRISFFAVPDFIDLHYNNFHWFTFNIADIFITIGIILILIKDFCLKNEKN